MDMLPLPNGPETYPDAVQRWTCESDLVVVGTPTGKKVFLTTHRSLPITAWR
jgi:hypothetical protein